MPASNPDSSRLDRRESHRYDAATSWRDTVLLRFSIHTVFWSLLLLLSATGIWLHPSAVLAAAYFEDGFLGLTQSECHKNPGRPQPGRDRKPKNPILKVGCGED